MDRAVYLRMNENEAEHWWFVARRRILQCAIERLVDLPDSPRLLEAGAGTGGNIEMLQRFGHLSCFEYCDEARHLAEAKTGMVVPFGALPDEIPFADERFDLILLFDVLEHVREDVRSLAALAQKLTDEGLILVTVPSYPWMWSHHDENHHHFRRYTRRSLSAAARSADLEVVTMFNFNLVLLPVIFALRMAKRLVGSRASDDVLPGRLANRVLTEVFAAERHLIGRVPMPIGLSLGVLLRRPQT